MTMLDATDEEIAKAVLKRLHDRGLRSLRKQEEHAPVSRGTLARWRGGDFEMQDDTREVCLSWLGAPAGILTTNYADGLRDAMRRYEESVSNALSRAKEEIEMLVAASPGLTPLSVGEIEEDVADESGRLDEDEGEIEGGEKP